MEDCVQKMEREREELQEEIRALQHSRDQSLLQAESDKQQVTFTMAASILYTEFSARSVKHFTLAFCLHRFGNSFYTDSHSTCLYLAL